LPEAKSPTLVPELLIADFDASLSFWCNLCGFEVVDDRPEEGFAYVARGSLQRQTLHDRIVARIDTTPPNLRRPTPDVR